MSQKSRTLSEKVDNDGLKNSKIVCPFSDCRERGNHHNCYDSEVSKPCICYKQIER